MSVVALLRLPIKLVQPPASDTQITHGGRIWLYVVAVIIMLLLVIPSIIVIPKTFSDSKFLEFPPEIWSTRWYDAYFNSTKWMRVTMTSLKIGFLTMLLATPIGTMAAYALYVSGHRFARAIFAFMITPMIVPVILIAIGTFSGSKYSTNSQVQFIRIANNSHRLFRQICIHWLVKFRQHPINVYRTGYIWINHARHPTE